MSILHPAIGAPRIDLGGAADFSVPFSAVLEDAAPGIVFAASVGITDGSATATLYLSDRGLVTGSEETPADTYFAPRLVQPLAYRRATSGARLGGAALFRGGELAFDLTDQALSVGGTSYTRRSLTDGWSVNGQPVEVRAIPAGYTWTTGMVLFRGTARRWLPASDGSIRVTLRGTAENLDTPLMPATYGGTGGLDGTAELKGLRKPMAFGGEIYNVEPVAVIPGELVYDLHCDRAGAGAPIDSVTAVKIGGVPLILDADYATTALLRAASIASGEYGTCLAEGRIRLGSTPGDTVTVDLTGATFSGAHPTTAGALAKAVLMAYDPQLSMGAFRGSTFSSADSIRPYTVSRWVGPQETLTGAQFMSELAGSVEAAWGDDSEGRLQFVLTERPAGGGSLAFADWCIADGSWEWTDLPADVTPAVREVTVRFGRNYQPLSSIGTAVTGDERAALAQEWRASVRSQAITRYAESRVLEVETLIDNATHAAALGDAILGLYDGSARLARWDGAHRAMTRQVGDKVTVELAREALAGDTAKVLGVDVDCSQMAFRLEVMV